MVDICIWALLPIKVTFKKFTDVIFESYRRVYLPVV